jgi:hypothetical protein
MLFSGCKCGEKLLRKDLKAHSSSPLCKLLGLSPSSEIFTPKPSKQFNSTSLLASEDDEVTDILQKTHPTVFVSKPQITIATKVFCPFKKVVVVYHLDSAKFMVSLVAEVVPGKGNLKTLLLILLSARFSSPVFVV